MLLLEANKLTYYIGDRLLLAVDPFKVYDHDRIGLVGRNGSGKTTLLQIISGKIILEDGSVIRHKHSELLPQLKRTDTTKSGGEITQEYIHEAIATNPGLLLADEPTTNLDTLHIEWLEQALLKLDCACMIVSHDRAFLDALCTKIWELEDGKLVEYNGNYSDYVKQKEIEHNQQQVAYEQYEKKKRQLEAAQRLKEQKAARATKKPKNLSSSEARIKGSKPYFAKKQKKLQKTATSIETRLEKLEKVEKVQEATPIKMDLPNADELKNRRIVRVEKLEGNIAERKLWNDVSFYVQAGDKLAIVGPNGSGKSTLIKKIIDKATGVNISPAVKIGYFSQNLNILAVDQSILENIQESSKQNETFIRTVLARLHFFDEDVYKKVEVLSGGERVKVALAKLFLADVNTLVLDEPTNFLDVFAMEALESLLKDYEGTIIFVSHDRQFIRQIATRLLVIENEEISLFEGNYDQYQMNETKAEHDETEEQLLLLETKISEVISRLSIEPTAELEAEFQQLMKTKRLLEAEDGSSR